MLTPCELTGQLASCNLDFASSARWTFGRNPLEHLTIDAFEILCAAVKGPSKAELWFLCRKRGSSGKLRQRRGTLNSRRSTRPGMRSRPRRPSRPGPTGEPQPTPPTPRIRLQRRPRAPRRSRQLPGALGRPRPLLLRGRLPASSPAAAGAAYLGLLPRARPPPSLRRHHSRRALPPLRLSSPGGQPPMQPARLAISHSARPERHQSKTLHLSRGSRRSRPSSTRR